MSSNLDDGSTTEAVTSTETTQPPPEPIVESAPPPDKNARYIVLPYMQVKYPIPKTGVYVDIFI